MALFLLPSTEFADARFARHKEHAKPPGRFHGVVVPRVHLRPQPLAAEQPAGGARGDQAQGPHALTQQQRLQPQVPPARRHRLQGRLQQGCQSFASRGTGKHD